MNQDLQHINTALFSDKIKVFIDENIQDFIELDTNGFVQSINPSLCELVGINENEAIGTHIKHIQFSKAKEGSKEHKNKRIEKNIELLLSKLRTQSKLSSSKDEKIAILTHDLFNHFNSMLGFLTLLKDNIRTYELEKIEKFIHIINNSATNAADLLKDSLKWVRSESGLLSFNLKPYVFWNIVDNELLKLNDLIADKNIKIVNKVDVNELVICDKYMIKTVVRNLITNAIKFSYSNGEVCIDLKETKTHQIIIIKDNGVGMHKEQLGTIFEVTENKSTSGTEGEKGTGLGLIICKAFVEKHNGTIKVTSELGKGTQFQVLLPKEVV